MLAVRTASPHPVARVAFAPCGGWFATAQPHHGVTLHDRASGEPIRTFGNTRRGDYASLLFLRGGAWLAAGGTKGLEVFDPHTGATVAARGSWYDTFHTLGCRADLVLCAGPLGVSELFFPPNPDPRAIADYWSGSDFQFYLVAPGAEWGIGFRSEANPVALDLVAKRAAHGLTHTARVDVANALTGRNLPTAAFAAFAPRVALCDCTNVAVFDLTPAAPVVETDIPAPLPVRRPTFVLPPPDRWPNGKPWRPPFTLTPDGRKLLVLRPRQRVQMWDVDAEAREAEWSWRLDGITCLAVAPDGLTAVAGGRFGRVLTWDLG